jgi:hypothetical protein
MSGEQENSLVSRRLVWWAGKQSGEQVNYLVDGIPVWWAGQQVVSRTKFW